MEKWAGSKNFRARLYLMPPPSNLQHLPTPMISTGRCVDELLGISSGVLVHLEIQIKNPETITINETYSDGVSITHGTPRPHIWSYAAGASETGSCNTYINCPCSNGVEAAPSFVGDNYYCESAYRGDCFTHGYLPDDPLWDGQQCEHEGTCCTGANTPPWFSVRLSGTTSDDIEVRICHD